jgi:arabinofuranosyltransferase
VTVADQVEVGGPRRRIVVASWALAAVPALISVLGAWAYRWVDEDAFINFRIIENLLAGHGPVYNVGERVEADSDPLWVATLALTHVVTPFLSLEWLSVLLGLVLTAAAFLLGGRAAQRLQGRRGHDAVLPVGLVVVGCVPVAWEFSTSGLETPMALAWIAGSWLLLMVAEEGRLRRITGVVMGLGGLIRPELLVAAAFFLAVLVAFDLRRLGWRSAMRLVLVASAAPLAFELFRMAYYGLLIPNTGLAKNAGGSWWSQGFTYLIDLNRPYGLWIPMALVVVLIAIPAIRWAAMKDRVGVILLLVPVAVGLLDAGYVLHVGGDYMHGRLLLPALFATCLPAAISVRQIKSAAVICSAGILVWAVVCVSALRVTPAAPAHLTIQTNFISDERLSWIKATGAAHPVTAEDYASALSGQAGRALRSEASLVPAGRQVAAVVINPFLPIDDAANRPASSSIPFRLTANIPGVGVVGYLAGPAVYVFDSFSLANPVGSHFIVRRHARPGHEKLVGPAWMLGRLSPAGVNAVPGAATRRQIDAARAAVGCGGLAPYLESITAPMSLGRALSNITGSLAATSLRFDADPVRAKVELCRTH